MPSIGIVVHKLFPNVDAESPSMLAKWRISQEIHEAWMLDNLDDNSSEPSYPIPRDAIAPPPIPTDPYPLGIYTGYETPTLAITISPWPSASSHFLSFASSPDMLDWIDEFGEVLSLAGAFHMNIPWSAVPTEVPYIALGRYWVASSDRAEFERRWAPFQKIMEGVSGGRCTAGWRVRGGWRQEVGEDHGATYAGLDSEGRQRVFADLAEEVDEEEVLEGLEEEDADGEGKEGKGQEAGLFEWVSLLGWESEERMNAIRNAENVALEDRGPEWEGLVPIVELSKKMTNHYIKKVNYMELSENGKEA